MEKALVTFGWDRAAPLLEVSLPTFRDYAERHGYDLIVSSQQRCDRPAAWFKVSLLQELLSRYDFVLWIDADAVILDASTDLADVVPDDAYQAFVVIDCDERFGTAPNAAPNTGVWALRAVPRAKQLLDAIWTLDDWAEVPYWENGALLRLMGWTLEMPFVKTRDSEWDAGTHILGEEWNAAPRFSAIGYQPAYIRHYAGMEYPLRLYELETDLARLEGRWPRYWLGRLKRRLRRHPQVYARARRVSARLRGRGGLTSS